MAEDLHLPAVAGLFISPGHRLPVKPVEEVRAVVERGLDGCAHGRAGSKRQVLLMDMETLEQLRLAPGAVKENITTRGLRLQALRPGQRLRIGQALLEVTLPCEPCSRMEEIRPGLKEELRGRRGMLCWVVEAGWIRCGDGIAVLDGTNASS